MKKLLLFSFLCFMSCTKDEDHKVHFTVECPRGRVFYDDENGTPRTAAVAGVWHYDFPGRDGQYLYLHAQNYDSTTTVTAYIVVDRTPISRSSMTGLDADFNLGTATATGNVP